MKVDEIIAFFDKVFPPELSEPWDHDGVMVLPNEKMEIRRAVAALDVTSETIDFAQRIGASLIVSHHPLIFDSLEKLDARTGVGSRVCACAVRNIAVLSYHTRFDAVRGGVNDCLCEAIGLTEVKKEMSCGRTGFLAEQMSYEDFSRYVKTRIGDGAYSGWSSGAVIKKVAVVSGSGADYAEEAKAAGADILLTGEAKHSDIIDCREIGLSILLATHHLTENVCLPKLKELLEGELYIQTEVFPYTI